MLATQWRAASKCIDQSSAEMWIWGNQSHKHCRKPKIPAQKQNGKCKDQKFWLKSTLFSSCRRARRANCAAHPAPLTQNLRAKVGGGDGRPQSQGVTGVLLGNSRPGTHKNGKMRPQRTYQLPVLMPRCFPSSSGHQAPLRNDGGWLQWQVDKISANFQPCNQAEKHSSPWAAMAGGTHWAPPLA